MNFLGEREGLRRFISPPFQGGDKRGVGGCLGAGGCARVPACAGMTEWGVGMTEEGQE